MSYDEQLADRVRRILGSGPDLTERRMFGGISFMIKGNMCCGIAGEDLILRIGAAEYEVALAEPHARPMDFTGRPMRGMVFVGAAGTRTDESLAAWVHRAVAFAGSLPPKW